MHAEMETLVRYLVRRRQSLLDQIRYLATHNTRLEETTNGERTDVTSDWLNRLQSDYSDVTQALIDAGVITTTQANSDALRWKNSEL